MKPTEGKLTATINAPKEVVAQIAVMSLNDNSYPAGLYNLLDEITTAKRKSQKTAGIGYDLEFSVRLAWVQVSEGSTKISVTVTEGEGHCSNNDCKKEAYKIIKGINDRATDFLKALTTTPPRTTYGNARWATPDDLLEANYITDKLKSNQLLLGPYTENNYVALPAEETVRHTLVCGPTGCGKTSTLFVPNLLERTECSAVVSEATAGTVQLDDSEKFVNQSPDLMQKTAGYRASKGHKIYYFNPDDLSSNRINPLDGVTTIRQASALATLLIKNTNLRLDNGGDPFWETSETALLTSLIMHCAGNNGNLGQVRGLLREGPKALAKLLGESNVNEARARYYEFLGWATETTRNSVVVGLIQRLELWTLPSVVALTETSDINFKDLQNELFTFYLAVPSNKPELKPCASLIFTFLLNFIIEKPQKHPCVLFLDEFSNFGYIPDFPNKLSIIRHRGVPAMLGLQDYNQAEEIYKSSVATLFSQPATRIYFKPQTLSQAKIISESLGTETVFERQVTSNCQIETKEIGRDLMTPGAVQMLERGRAIVFTASTNPINLVRFQPDAYNDRSKIPPPSRRILQVDDRLVRQCMDARELHFVPVHAATESASLNATAGSIHQQTRPSQSLYSAPKTNEDFKPQGERSQQATPEQPELEKPYRRSIINEHGDRIPGI